MEHAAEDQQRFLIQLCEELRDIPLEIGRPEYCTDNNSLCRVSIFQRIPPTVRDSLIKKAVTETKRDRAIGCLMGLAVGDTVGSPLEFLPVLDPPVLGAPSFNRESLEYVGALNTFELQPGQWTDDTSIALCLADSLILRNRFDGSDARARFWNWCFHGYNNAFRLDPTRIDSIGLGKNIAASLYALEPFEVPPPRYEAGNQDAGNGSIMRLAPVPIFYHRDPVAAARFGAESSFTTHPGPIAAEACAFLAWLLVRALQTEHKLDPKTFLDDVTNEYLVMLGQRTDDAGKALRTLLESECSSDSLERNWNWKADSLDLVGTIQRRGKSYNGYPVNAGYFGSYCMDGLAMAMHAVYHSTSFEAAIESCVNFLGDADSTAAVAGQIAGAIYGYSSIDPRLIDNIRRWDDGEIAFRGLLLYELGELKR